MKKKPEPRLLAAARRIARRMRTRARSQGAHRRPEGAHWRRRRRLRRRHGPASDQALPSSTYLVRWPDAFRLRSAARKRPARAGQCLCRVEFPDKCNPKKKLQEIPHPLKFRIINCVGQILRSPPTRMGAHSSRRRRAGGSSSGQAGPQPTDHRHLCSGPRPGARVPRAPGKSRPAHPSDAEPPGGLELDGGRRTGVVGWRFRE